MFIMPDHTNCPGLDLLGRDWIESLKLFDKPLNAICNKTIGYFRFSNVTMQFQSG